MWSIVFGVANGLALMMWAVLICLPRKPALLAAVLYLGVGFLCAAYVLALVGLLTGVLPGGDVGRADFSSLAGLKAIFASDGGMTIGWLHYLAFDLFVGLWIARDADAKGFSRLVQAPIMLTTFLGGPLGLLIWLGIRERRARAAGRWE